MHSAFFVLFFLRKKNCCFSFTNEYNFKCLIKDETLVKFAEKKLWRANF